jgi:hypothetical protein
MATTALPQVINGILTAFNASVDLSGVRIFDGPEIDSSYPGDFIAVGHDGSEDGEVSVSNVTQSFEQLGNLKQFEDGSVDCWLATWDGGTSLSDRRTRVATLLSAVDTAIRADVSLGGACIYSSLSNHQMTYIQANNGVAISVTFTITYRART